MIGKVKGELTEKLPGSVLVAAGPIEYEVALSLADWQSAKVGESASFYIYENIKEDAYNLIGFSDYAAKELFVRLLSVNGVGPKSALSILSSAAPDKILQAVSSGSAELFAGVAGVGKKTAERIVVELKGKLAPTAASAMDNTYKALVGLGYTAAQAAEAVAALPADATDDAERVKLALRSLAK